MTSTAQPVSTPVHAPSATANASTAASGPTSSNVRSSYANAAATKGKQTNSPAIVSSNSSAAVGAQTPSHASSNSVSPVNGKPSAPPAVPSMGGGPAIVNSSIANGTNSSDHTRKPSVTITAQGTTGFVPNGAAARPSGKPPVQFGSLGTPSPHLANSVPHVSQASLGTNLNNPGPARSPSPIPHPQMASGGGLPAAGRMPAAGVSFGSLQDGSEQTSRPAAMTPVPSFPAAQHLRRESSQSNHSDMSPSMNRNFVPNNNRGPQGGRGFTPGQYPASPNFRPNVMQQRTPSNVQYPPGRPNNMPIPGSPYQQTRSPAMPPAHLQQQQMPGNQHMSHPYGGYPQHHLNPQQNPGMYVPQQQFDPNYAAFYGQQMYNPGMHPMYPGAPPSPRPFAPQFQPGSYGPPAQVSMSRQSSSHGPDRPNSTLGQAPPSTSHTPQTPATGSASPAPTTSSFTRPEPRKSKAILIKNPLDGEVVDFKKSVTSPSPVPQSRGPVVVSSGTGVPSTSTPPPRAAVASPQHVRTDSQPAKSSEDVKRELQEKIQRQLKGDAPEDKKESEDKIAKEKEEADRKAKEVEAAEAAKAAEEKEAADKAKVESDKAKAEDDEAEKKRKDDEEMEKMIAEMEAQEREEEERQKAYDEKKRLEKEAKAKAAAESAEEDLRRQEREAEELEEARAKGKQAGDDDAEAKALFAQLKPNTQFGVPTPTTAPASGASTPVSEPPTVSSTEKAPAPKAAPALGKQKPMPLKLETHKTVEPPQPTPGMKSLQSARFLQVKESESLKYPDGFMSPNPAINPLAKKTGRSYDKKFLLQFQDVFKEKPSIDWDKTIKETVGDSSDSAQPRSARPSSAIGGGRQPSRGGPGGMPGALGGPMGNFASSRPLPANSTSEQRFQASLGAQPARPAAPQFGSFAGGRPGTGFPMGAPGMIRSTSSQSISGGGMNSPRNASSRGTGGRNSRRGAPNHQQEAQLAKTMPLTAGADLKPLEVSKSGWKPASIVAPQQTQVLPGTHMAPDMVQRKVKAALNKMTPEKFDKIANDILVIASQSRDETDGRTLRQVIQLTFEKACDEAHWASMYAKFCKRMLEEMGPEIKDENVRDKAGNVVVGGALFRKYLLNRCQEEFERGWEVNLPEKPEGASEEVMLSDEYYIAAAAKRKGLGLIQFIGELYKLNMLTLRIMHECVIKLLQFEGLPDEAAVESLVKLLRTIGATMDPDPKGHTMIDTYFERIRNVKDMDGLPSRLFYMLEDIIDLREKLHWRSKDDQKGPKTIQEIREDAILAQQNAEMERARKPQGRPQAGRGDARSFSHQGMPPPDYPRNQVGMDDLRRLSKKAGQSSAGPAALGPNSMLSGSRSSSGRRGLGPMARGGDESGASSRTGTPPVKEKESSTHVNAFSALAGLDASGDPDEVASPPSIKSSPVVTKAQPASADDTKEANGTVKGS